ncbi:MAG: cupredoxin domain-containing protein [Acidimicrobiia bacterium]
MRTGRKTGAMAASGALVVGMISWSGAAGAQEGGHESAGPRPGTYGHEATPDQAGRTVDIVMHDDFRFEPAEIPVKRDEVVTYEGRNAGAIEHEITIGGPKAQELHEEQMATMPGGMDHGSGGGGDGDVMSEEMKELEKEAAFSTSIHVPPGGTKRVTWAFTGPEAPMGGCHIPGHFPAGMRMNFVFSGTAVGDTPDEQASGAAPALARTGPTHRGLILVGGFALLLGGAAVAWGRPRLVLPVTETLG